jgi:hypothetical protein
MVEEASTSSQQAGLSQQSLHYPDGADTISSDLEDCPELWREELGSYIMESYHRERGIEAWFEQELVVSSRVFFMLSSP